MKKLNEKFFEFKNSIETNIIPFKDSIIWIKNENEIERYFWIESKDISYVSWTNGIVSIIPHPESILSSYFQVILINSTNVLIGNNIKIGN